MSDESRQNLQYWNDMFFCFCDGHEAWEGEKREKARQAHQQIKKLIEQKPRVSRRDVKEAFEIIRHEIHDGALLTFLKAWGLEVKK